jgi:hypothetical protein
VSAARREEERCWREKPKAGSNFSMAWMMTRRWLGGAIGRGAGREGFGSDLVGEGIEKGVLVEGFGIQKAPFMVDHWPRRRVIVLVLRVF